MFNVREGMAREDDQLPRRVLQQPAFGFYEKEAQCATVNFDDMLDEYYDARKWDKKTGKPSEEVLKGLGLEFS
jgi:aldehyde:ferredoxin oxidoreductase